MNKGTYRIVLIGCGQIGAAHLNEMYYRDSIEVYGVVDIEPDRAKIFMKKYGALSWDTDYMRYLSDSAVDICIIATYPSTHLKIMKKCLEYGKHVLCEKPIAASLEEAEEFARIVKESNLKVLIGHLLRHNKTYGHAVQMIHNDAIGKPIVVRMVQNHHTMDWSRYLKLLADSSPIVDCGIHYIDIMKWITCSKVLSVSGISARTEPDVPDGRYNYGMLCIRFEDGSVGYYKPPPEIVLWRQVWHSIDSQYNVGSKVTIQIPMVT